MDSFSPVLASLHMWGWQDVHKTLDGIRGHNKLIPAQEDSHHPHRYMFSLLLPRLYFITPSDGLLELLAEPHLPIFSKIGHPWLLQGGSYGLLHLVIQKKTLFILPTLLFPQVICDYVSKIWRKKILFATK